MANPGRGRMRANQEGEGHSESESSVDRCDGDGGCNHRALACGARTAKRCFERKEPVHRHVETGDGLGEAQGWHDPPIQRDWGEGRGLPDLLSRWSYVRTID